MNLKLFRRSSLVSLASAATGSIAAGSSPVSATPTYYVGYDTTAATFTQLTNNPGPPTVPGTLTAQSAFTTASGAQHLGSVQQYDFGNLTSNTSTTGGNVSGGVTSTDGEINVSFTNESFVNVYSTSISNLSNQGQNNVPNGGTSETLGFSTASLTGNYILVQGSTGLNTVLFTFTKPVTSFGLFITGLGNSGGSPVTASFNDGTAESYVLNGSSATSGAFASSTANYTQTPTSTGGAEYFSFTDTSGVSSVLFSQTNGSSDRYSFDNFTYSVVPEPGTLASLCIGAMVLGGLIVSRRRTGARAS